MKVGDKVKATQRICEDDWYEGVEWDEDHEPYQIEEGTEGIVTKVDSPFDGFCSVTFGDLKDVLVTYESDFEPFIEVVLVNDNQISPPGTLQPDSQYGLSDDEQLNERHEQQRRNRRYEEGD